MGQIKRKAYITFDDYYDKVMYNEEWDIYFYPTDITEWELAEEISSLVEFYDVLDYPIYWPPHLRKEKVTAWVEAQRNIFCKNYEKGCMLNATK